MGREEDLVEKNDVKSKILAFQEDELKRASHNFKALRCSLSFQSANHRSSL
jgi:hypothetical protein